MSRREIDMLNRRIRYLRERVDQENNPAGAVRGELHATTMAMIYLRACMDIDLDDLRALLDAAKKYAQSKDTVDLANLGATASQAMASFVVQRCAECGADERRTHKKRCSKSTPLPRVLDESRT